MRYEIYGIAGGFGYRIISDSGTVLITQEFDPDVEGFQAMSSARAEQLATNYIANYVPPVVIEDPAPKTPEQLRIEQLEAALLAQNESQSAFMEFVLQTMGVE